MKWRGRRGSRNIEDRRGRSGGGTGMKLGGVGGVGALAVLAIGYFLGIDVTPLLDDGFGTSGSQTTQTRQLTAQEQAAGEFIAVTLADTEEVWTEIFDAQLGRQYDAPVLVLFSQQTNSPCGGASGATGPFYCPADEKAYLDTAFFATMRDRLGADGDFAAAYVVAHEIAHHVQNELGILPEANRARSGASESKSNRISVMIELQADCFSGLWSRQAEARFGSLEPGDIDEALNAARQIGDDVLQRNAGRVPQPHTFTHGTAEQRQRWFARGYESGNLGECDTFSPQSL